MGWNDYRDFSILKGMTLTNIDRGRDACELDQIIFTTECGRKFKQYHEQDCCESVDIDDICGELSDLLGSEILLAEEVTNSTDDPKEGADSFTWTFYKLSTIKGSVTIKWYGESNGYYSESVDFEEITKDD